MRRCAIVLVLVVGLADRDWSKTPLASLVEVSAKHGTTGVAAYLTSIWNVTFRDNLFTDTVPRKQELPYRAQFYLENAHGAKILNNTWIESACVKAPGVEWDSETCRDIVIAGNSVRPSVCGKAQ